MTYIIKTFDDDVIEITDEDHKNLIGKTGLVYISSIDESINLNSVSRIVKADQYHKESEGKSNEGMLHDGIPVIRYFGNWYLKGEMIEDSSGRLVPSRVIDPTCYKEVARDCVPTTKYFKETLEALPKEERLKLILENNPERNGGLKSMSELLEEKN